MQSFTLDAFEEFLETHKDTIALEIEKNIPRGVYILENAQMYFGDDTDLAMMCAMGEIIESYSKSLAAKLPKKILKKHIGVQAADQAAQAIRVLMSLRLASIAVAGLEGMQ